MGHFLPICLILLPFWLNFKMSSLSHQGLEPSQTCDHAIHLLPKTNPVQVRPYWYPHFQKKEMEKLDTEMLNDGIIRPSTRPFWSLVILIHRKDDTWHFCVDYRAHNTVSIHDRFPIPTINKLFDELHGVQYFSKLDLLARYHQIIISAWYEQLGSIQMPS